MNDAQFPKQRPHGVAFDTLNILEPIPDKYKAQFDLVHLRLLVCGLPTGLWQTAAGNVLQLLKPGGWVQWMEIDVSLGTAYCYECAITDP